MLRAEAVVKECAQWSKASYSDSVSKTSTSGQNKDSAEVTIKPEVLE